MSNLKYKLKSMSNAGNSVSSQFVKRMAQLAAREAVKQGVKESVKYLTKRKRVGGSGKTSKRVKGTNENSVNTRDAKVRGKNKKGVSFKPKSKVVVTKKFRNMVNQALLPQKYTGFMLETGCFTVDFPISFGQRQIVERIGQPQATAGEETFVFEPLRVLNAASVLFTGATPTEQTKYSIADGKYFVNPADHFDWHTTKIPVVNSYASYVFRNNTNRTWIMDLYEVAPRKDMDPIMVGDFKTQWINALANEYVAGTVENDLTERVNIDNSSIYTLYQAPHFCKTLMKDWKVEKHSIVLDPGQSYDHFMQGPSNVTYDFGKFWRNQGGTQPAPANLLMNLKKEFTRQLIMVARLDLVHDGTTPGRYGLDDDKIAGLIYEYKYFMKVQAPEQTGGNVKVGALNTEYPVKLNYKRDSYCIKNYRTVTTDPDTRIEEQTGQDNEDDE